MAIPVILLAGSVLFYVLGKIFKLSRRSSHTLMLAAGLSNTSFVGFPLIQAYYGASALPIGIVSDQMTFFLLSTIGVVIAMKGNLKRGKAVDLRYILKRVFTFPPLVGCLLALIVPRIIDLSFLDDFFGSIASTVSPIALFSIGLQLNFGLVKQEVPNIAYAALYKLIIGPAILVLLAFLLELKGRLFRYRSLKWRCPVWWPPVLFSMNSN